MRVYYPVKAVHLLLALTCLTLLLKSKNLCAFKDPRSTLPRPQMDCHTSLIETTFGVENNATLLGESGNETVAEKPIPFVLRSCIRIVESDIYRRPGSLSPLLAVLLPACLLVLEAFLIVLQTARVVTSYQVPDLVSTIFTNLLHGVCWVATAITLYLLRIFWEQNWMELSPEFVPLYPTEYFYAEEIAWVCILALLAEATLCHGVIYHNLTLEGKPREEEEPPRLIATYRDDGRLLNGN